MRPLHSRGSLIQINQRRNDEEVEPRIEDVKDEQPEDAFPDLHVSLIEEKKEKPSEQVNRNTSRDLYPIQEEDPKEILTQSFSGAKHEEAIRRNRMIVAMKDVGKQSRNFRAGQASPDNSDNGK